MEQRLRALLKQHEEVARQRVEELRAELAALNERIAAEQTRVGKHAAVLTRPGRIKEP